VRSRRDGGEPRGELGATTVEFALVATVFFMIVFGIIDVSRVWGMHERLRAAVREGARVAAVQTDPIANAAAAKTAVKNAALPFGGPGVTDAQISVGLDSLNRVTVSVLNYSMPLITPFAGTFGHSSVSLSATAIMPWYRAP